MKRLALILLLCVICCSCDKSATNRKETFPVKGTLVVDGNPVGQLAVKCYDVKGMDTANPTVSAAFTDENGNFEISTYEQGDGVPVGSYVLTVVWGQRNLLTMQYGGPDKLNGKYDDPETSTIRFEVQQGVPTELGKIELTTE